MAQKKLQSQCSNIKQGYRNVKVIKKGSKKIYKASVAKGGILSLIIKIPASKFAQKVRDMFFQRVNERR